MGPWLLSTLVVLGPGPDPGAASRVEIDVSGLEQHLDETTLHRFHGDLLMRLLEAGHGVGQGGGVRLSLRSADEAIVVECIVGDARERVVVQSADAPVLGLELVHRAVELAGVCAPVGPSLDGILIDGDSLGPVELSELAIELAELSITLVADEHAAAWRLCVSDDRSAAVVIPIEARCETAGLADAPAVAIERWRERGAPSSPEPETPGPATPPVRPDPDPAASGRDGVTTSPDSGRAWGGSIGVAAGVQLGLRNAAANLRADVAALHLRGLLLGVAGVFAPSRAEQLAMIDASALAIVGWRGVMSDRLVFRPSVGLGLGIHRFVYPSEAVRHHLDLDTRVGVELELRLAARTFLSFSVAGSFATRRVEHRLDEEVIWARGVVRLEALVGLRFEWVPSARVAHAEGNR